MRALTRYVLLELAKVFLVTLAALTSLLTVYFGLHEALDQDLGMAQVVQLLPYLLPDILRLTLPATALFAACSVYGRMSGSNEVVALKALGISPMAILWPAMIVAFLLSLATVWLNDLAVSWGRYGIRQVVIESIEEIAYGTLRTKKSYGTRNFSIIVKQVEGRRLIQPAFTLASGDGLMTVTADEAELISRPAEKVLIVACRNGRVDVPGKASFEFPDDYELPIPLGDASRLGEDNRMPSWMALAAIPREIEEQERLLLRAQQELATKAAFQMLTGDMQSLSGVAWGLERQELVDMRTRLFRLQTEPHRRWSNGFSCLLFAMVGAPMAIMLRRADFLQIFIICFLPILIVYYPLLAYGVDGAKSGYLPSYAVWLGNVVLAVWSYWAVRRILRY